MEWRNAHTADLGLGYFSTTDSASLTHCSEMLGLRGMRETETDRQIMRYVFALPAGQASRNKRERQQREREREKDTAERERERDMQLCIFFANTILKMVVVREGESDRVKDIVK